MKSTQITMHLLMVNILVWKNTILFSASSSTVKIRGMTNPIVIRKQPEISCHIDYFVIETVRFTWSVADRELPGQSHRVVFDDSNIANYSSVLNYTFSRDDDRMSLCCSFVTTTGFKSEENMMIHLHCKCSQCYIQNEIPVRASIMVYKTSCDQNSIHLFERATDHL